MSEEKYFTLNKAEDFSSGIYDGCFIDGNKLTIASERNTAWFFSKPIDCGIRGNRWRRVEARVNCAKDCMCNISVYCVDTAFDRDFVTEAMFGDSVTIDRRLAAIEHFRVVQFSNVYDFLIHDAVGRYLFIYIDLFGQNENVPAVHMVKLYFGGRSIADYMPEIYREGDSSFLERFLSIFSSMYFSLEDKIDDISGFLDPDVVSNEFLLWLSEILNIEDAYLWREARLRKLIKNAIVLYRKKGTLDGLSKLVELYTENRPLIVETFRLREFLAGTQSEDLKRLYGNNLYTVTVIVPENSVKNQIEQRALHKIVGGFLPANIEYRLVVLRNTVLLGQYTYLGINSCITGYENLVINESMQLPFAKLGG